MPPVLVLGTVDNNGHHRNGCSAATGFVPAITILVGELGAVEKRLREV